MAKNPSRNRRFIMTKNLIMMLVVLVVGLLAVWSWFTINKTVTANQIRIKADLPGEVSLAKALKTYENGTLVNEGPDVFSSSINFTSDYQFTKDCTGDGKTLLVPDFSVIKDKEEAIKKGRIVNLNGPWEEALSNVEVDAIKAYNPDEKVEARYMEFEFYARSRSKSVTVMANSKLVAESGALNTYSDTKKSSYGNFNVDGLVGAMRVALVCQGASGVSQRISSGAITKTNGIYTSADTTATLNPLGEEVTMLWVPRPDVKLNPDPLNDGRTDNWTLTTGVTSSQFDGETYKHFFFAPVSTETTGTKKYPIRITDSNNNTFDIDENNGVIKTTGVGVEEVEGTAAANSVVVTSSSNASANPPTLGQEVNASNFKATGYNDSLTPSSLSRIPNQPYDSQSNAAWYYVFKYKLRIWIEGTDSEARRAMNGGAFSLDMRFK